MMAFTTHGSSNLELFSLPDFRHCNASAWARINAVLVTFLAELVLMFFFGAPSKLHKAATAPVSPFDLTGIVPANRSDPLQTPPRSARRVATNDTEDCCGKAFRTEEAYRRHCAAPSCAALSCAAACQPRPCSQWRLRRLPVRQHLQHVRLCFRFPFRLSRPLPSS